MAKWAIVIGIDQYWTPRACLTGAVHDALKMYEWLTSDDGGDVPRTNVFLHLAATSGGTQIPADLAYRPANYPDIVKAIGELIGQSNGQGDRFFFYYSGHGLMSRIDAENESGITTADFTADLTTMSLTLGSIYERFRATRFEEQFFFIDACRNIPYEGEFRLGLLPRPGGRPTPPTPPQYIMYATSPGLMASDVKTAGPLQPGYEGGAFTDALLMGLRGEGWTFREDDDRFVSPKTWDDERGEYVVSWYELFRFVEAEVKGRKIKAGAGELFQTPTQGGDRGGQDPDPRVLPPGKVPQ